MTHPTETDGIADVVVIGAGPSGAITTHHLASQGLNVVCLEQGDWVNPTDYPANRPEWELLIQKQWSHDRTIGACQPTTRSTTPTRTCCPRCTAAVGGSTIFYGAGVAPDDTGRLPRILDGRCRD